MKLRSQVWKAVLGMYKVSSLEYVTFIKRGASPLQDKIMNDVFRTCATDKMFLEVVNHDMITRVLNAFVWKAMGTDLFLSRCPKLTLDELAIFLCSRHECTRGSIFVWYKLYLI